MAAPKKSALASAAQVAQAAASAQVEAVAANTPMFTIEDGIPFPEKRVNFAHRESIYPFDKLAIGQSFLVPPTDKNPTPTKTLSSLASRQSRALYPRVFVTGREMVNGAECVRVWRKPDATEPLAPPRKRAPKAAPAAEQAPAPSFG